MTEPVYVVIPCRNEIDSAVILESARSFGSTNGQWYTAEELFAAVDDLRAAVLQQKEITP